jgi:hypothetical protein
MLVVLLLVFAVNYMDRQLLGLLSDAWFEEHGANSLRIFDS